MTIAAKVLVIRQNRWSSVNESAWIDGLSTREALGFREQIERRLKWNKRSPSERIHRSVGRRREHRFFCSTGKSNREPLHQVSADSSKIISQMKQLHFCKFAHRQIVEDLFPFEHNSMKATFPDARSEQNVERRSEKRVRIDQTKLNGRRKR